MRRVRDAGETEGWGVFEAEGSMLIADGKRPLQLQKWDESDRFEDDRAAWTYVVRRAEAGSRHHRLTLRYLRRFSRPEWIEVMCGHPVPQVAS